ncbi:aldehyde dehydrogenase family protein [Streptomyces sp. NPDC047043]|uniref:aldehyde dehydrogenase family protein n=1 Tax=Streptomyces sp. NPDC047043 TaxID=3154497 RepID=UPI0033D75D23
MKQHVTNTFGPRGDRGRGGAPRLRTTPLLRRAQRSRHQGPRARSGSSSATAGPAGRSARPFGGYKHSGFGRSLGSAYLEDWTQVKAVLINAG